MSVSRPDSAPTSRIGGRTKRDRQAARANGSFVGRDQLPALDQTEVFDADVETGEECGATDFAAPPTMAQLEGAG